MVKYDKKYQKKEITQMPQSIKKRTQKLDIMIEEAFKNDIVVFQDDAILSQHKKVDELMKKVEHEKG